MLQTRNHFTVIGKVAGSLLVIFTSLVIILVVIEKIQTSHEHTKLLNELRSLNLSSSEPQIVSFENESTNPELLLSGSYPGVHVNIPLAQTTLGNEINNIKSALGNQHFSINYNSQSTPTVITGTSKNYFINISLEFNGSEPQLVSTGQKSNFNGEPIFAQPGADTKINGLQINLGDTSKLNPPL